MSASPKAQGPDAYFDAYNDVEVHRTMLSDEPRNRAYELALRGADLALRGADLAGKTVLDVGAGTGFLSMLAARHGAKHVFAVEASAMAEVAEALVEQNGLSARVTVVRGRVEDVVLPVEKVDVIVSEWMGFYLVHENMLESVLIARDRFLKPDGVMLPGVCAIRAAPVSMDKLVDDRLGFWQRGVHGVDLSLLLPAAVRRVLSKPEVCVLDPGQVLAPALTPTVLDLHTTTIGDLRCILLAAPARCSGTGTAAGIAVWFDAFFTSSRPAAAKLAASQQAAADTRMRGEEADPSVGAVAVGTAGVTAVLGTGPEVEETHWKQTVFMLRDMYAASPGTVLPVGLLLVPDADNPRWYTAEPRAGAEVQELLPLYEAAKARAR